MTCSKMQMKMSLGEEFNIIMSKLYSSLPKRVGQIDWMIWAGSFVSFSEGPNLKPKKKKQTSKNNFEDMLT
jgi:hypothetical protein